MNTNRTATQTATRYAVSSPYGTTTVKAASAAAAALKVFGAHATVVGLADGSYRVADRNDGTLGIVVPC